jgi:hypothetical protein
MLTPDKTRIELTAELENAQVILNQESKDKFKASLISQFWYVIVYGPLSLSLGHAPLFPSFQLHLAVIRKSSTRFQYPPSSLDIHLNWEGIGMNINTSEFSPYLKGEKVVKLLRP